MAKFDLAAELEAAARADPLSAADALVTSQLGRIAQPISPEGMQAAANLVGRDYAPFLIEQVAARKLLRPFALAMVARGAKLSPGWETAVADAPLPASDVPALEDGQVALSESPEEVAGEAPVDDDEEGGDAGLERSNVVNLGAFEDRAYAFRSRILVDGAFAGSGFLVGPSTVMTAWHVIAPAQRDPPGRIEVAFSDGQRIAASVPVSVYSRCSDKELKNEFPKNDQEVLDMHDVAVLALTRPAGASLGVARLPDVPRIRRDDAVFVTHFPEGKDHGIGIGTLMKVPRMKSRWGHSVKTGQGSSGAGCFDAQFRLAGLHQGKGPKNFPGRLVPVTHFPPAVLTAIANDEAPESIWSLDGTVEGELVIGRQGFFHAFAMASKASTPVRGIRIKRVNAAADESGLAFSYRMLEQMIARSIATQVVRISFDSVVEDLADEIARRAAIVGLDIGPIDDAPGVAAGETSPDAVATDRGRRAAIALDALASAQGVRAWVFFEHPSAVFSEALRAAFDGFIDQALRLTSLRLVVAGFEAVSIPGFEYPTGTAPSALGPPGFALEYISGFTQADVEFLVRRVADALGKPMSQDLARARAEDALSDIPGGINTVYPSWQAVSVVAKLRPALRRLLPRQARNGAVRRVANG